MQPVNHSSLDETCDGSRATFDQHAMKPPLR